MRMIMIMSHGGPQGPGPPGTHILVAFSAFSNGQIIIAGVPGEPGHPNDYSRYAYDICVFF